MPTKPVLLARELASNDNDGSRWQLVFCRFVRLQLTRRDGTIWIRVIPCLEVCRCVDGQWQMGIEVALHGIPVILSTAKNGFVNPSCEIAFALALQVLEYEIQTMTGVLVFIDQHDGPFPIGPFYSISRHDLVSGAIVDVGYRREERMRATVMLEPFAVNHLAGEELGERLFDLILGPDLEHAKSAWGIIAATFHCER